MHKKFWRMMALCGTCPVSAFAADQLPPVDSRHGIEEVIVTAQRREERIQDVPMSITALGTEQLERMGFTNFSDLAERVPTLNIAPFFGSSSALKLYIRGVGQESPTLISRDQAVGVYFDDVYIAHGNALTLELGDTERVEVLAGPQGTLYGRNTVGGAVKFISAKPTGKWGFKQAIDGGNFGTFRSVTNVNFPEFANLSTKITVLRSLQDGWVKNPSMGGDFGDKNAEGYRGAVRWQQSDTLVVDYTYDFARQDGTNLYQQRQYNFPLFPFNYPLFVDRQEVAARPVNLPIRDDFESQGHSLIGTWSISDLVSLKSITAFRRQSGETLQDAVESFNLPILNGGTVTVHQFSQEVLLSGATSDSAIKYHAGAFYFRENGFQSLTSLLSPFALALQTPFVPPTLADLGPPLNANVINKSTALFGQVTWVPPILDGRVSLDIGGRYSWDTRIIQKTQQGVLTPFAGKTKYSSFDPSGTIDFRWTEDTHTYFRVAKAYRAGGFDTSNTLPNPFGPERLISYEVGVKSTFLDDRARLNVSAFQQNYRGIQLSYTAPDSQGTLATQTVNAGRGRIRGIDGQFEVAPVDRLKLSANVTYLHSTSTATNPYTGQVDSGQLPNIPTWKYSISADYNFGALPVGGLSGNVTFDFHDRELGTGAVVLSDYKPSYGLISARLIWSEIEVGDATLSLSIWGKNLADKSYQVYHNSGSVIFGQPRTVGASLLFNY